jgi:periplasmic divalent cation tolerance protein
MVLNKDRKKMDSKSYAVVMTTTSSVDEADKIARALLEKKLAACVQVLPMRSYYTWKDKLNIENENLLLIKGKRSDYGEIEKCIKDNHSYEVAEIIQVPIENGSRDYLKWIAQITQ